MFKLSRFILCILIVISYLYKSVCSSDQPNDDPSDPSVILRRNNSQGLHTLIGLINLLAINNDNGDSRHRHFVREQWTRSHRSSPEESRPKLPANDIGDSSSQFYDELLNIPLQHWDLRKLEKYPLLKEFIIRNENNRNLIYTPRPGRDAHNDDCIEIVRFRPPFAPRLGKKSFDNLSPKLGRQCSELADRRK